MSYSYDHRFMKLATRINTASAEVVVPLALGFFSVKSVLDCGCAQGNWLKVWLANGVPDVLGIDGDYIDRDQLLIGKECFHTADLGNPIDLHRRFDLAMSLEVAEHLPEKSAAVLVDTLTRHAPLILFSAAPQGQGGECHINEQPYEYWRDLFHARGFDLYDPFRPLLRGNNLVQPWYRHNLLMFVDGAISGNLPEAVCRHAIPHTSSVPDWAPLSYRVRRGIVRLIPQSIQGVLSRWSSFLR